MTGTVVKRLIENLAMEIPEMMIGEMIRKKKKIEMKRENKNKKKRRGETQAKRKTAL